MIMMIGLAIDYGVAYKMRTKMQTALDAAAVSVAQASLGGATGSKLMEVARHNYERALGFGVPGAITHLKVDDEFVKARASGDSPTYILSFAGLEAFEVSVDTQIRIANYRSRQPSRAQVDDVVKSVGGDPDDVADTLADLSAQLGHSGRVDPKAAQQALEDLLRSNPDLQRALEQFGGLR